MRRGRGSEAAARPCGASRALASRAGFTQGSLSSTEGFLSKKVT